MRTLSTSRFFGCVTISSPRRAGAVTLGALPRGPRGQSRVIEMQTRRPGEAGEQLLKMTRPIAREDLGPDVDYED
jgi:hypothetical protein